jgi:light-regulated signal transduction histidine kinase (bacteriophytochrome)
MNRLISDILVLSRATQSELVKEDVDMSTLARDLIKEFQQKDPQRDVQISIAEGLVAHGDRRFLSVVLQNLLSNAWKYSSKTQRARIEFGRTAKDGQDVFYVRDNGAGFDPAHADSLFVAFQRLHTAEEFEGIGIGLATVHKVIDRHGGRIWAESTPGHGATFYFRMGEATT